MEEGSGKTSMLYTILDVLRNGKDTLNYEANEKDIIFQTIDPDVFNSEDDVMGWIINLFQNEVEKINFNNKNFCNDYPKKVALIKLYKDLQDTYIRSTKFYKETVAKKFFWEFRTQ